MKVSRRLTNTDHYATAPILHQPSGSFQRYFISRHHASYLFVPHTRIHRCYCRSHRATSAIITYDHYTIPPFFSPCLPGGHSWVELNSVGWFSFRYASAYNHYTIPPFFSGDSRSSLPLSVWPSLASTDDFPVALLGAFRHRLSESKITASKVSPVTVYMHSVLLLLPPIAAAVSD